MGHNTWNAQRWHRRHIRPSRARRGPGLWAPTLVVAIALVTGAVAATHGGRTGEPDMIGICHALPGADGGQVYLVVARNGADHQAHAEHVDDVLDVHGQEDCLAAAPATAQPAEPTCTHVEHEGAAASGPAHAVNETEENASEPPHPDHVGICDADVALNHSATMDPKWLVLTLRVDSVGTGEANDVRLHAGLPDVGRPWRLEGAAARCGLDNRSLDCEFGDLLAGASRSVTVTAARCEDDCGDDIQASARVMAYNDGNATNDAALPEWIIPDCPRDESPKPSPTQPTPTNQTGNETSNQTDPDTNETQDPTNQTGNQTEPDNATQGNETSQDNATQEPVNDTTEPDNASSAPAPGDAAVAQRAQQDADQVTLSVLVRSIGPGRVSNAQLTAELPDLRRSWHLSGTDAQQCTLEERLLRCWFGDLSPEETRSLTLGAYTDRMPCGQHLTSLVNLSADNDGNANNDRSGASIRARPC